jgi:hypothetical protein
LNIAGETVSPRTMLPAIAVRGRLACRARCYRCGVTQSTTKTRSGLDVIAHAVYRRARPTRVPSALHHEQIALAKSEDVERLERSDKNK